MADWNSGFFIQEQDIDIFLNVCEYAEEVELTNLSRSELDSLRKNLNISDIYNIR